MLNKLMIRLGLKKRWRARLGYPYFVADYMRLRIEKTTQSRHLCYLEYGNKINDFHYNCENYFQTPEEADKSAIQWLNKRYKK